MLRSILATSIFALAATPAPAQEAATGFDIERYRDGFSAEQLIGADVVGTAGEEFGEVQSLILTPEGQIERVVVEVGGFLDIGDKAIAVPWDRITFDVEGRAVRANGIDADNVEDFSLFGDREAIDPEGRRFRADELLDDYVRTAGDRYFGYVHDLIFSREGQLGGIVVTPDVMYPTASYMALPWHGYGDGIGFDPGDDTYTVPAMDDETAVYDPFPYREWQRGGELAL